MTKKESNLVTILLVFCWPIGLILMWARPAYSLRARLVITSFFGMIMLFAFMSMGMFFSTNVATTNTTNLDLVTEKITEFNKRVEEIKTRTNALQPPVPPPAPKPAETAKERAFIVVSSPPADVYQDGEKIGKTPYTQMMGEEDAPVFVELRATGYKILPVIFRPDGKLNQVYNLEPEAPAPAAAKPAPAAPPNDTYTLIRVMEQEIKPMRPVEFETGSHVLRATSYPLLDEVARAISQHEITKLLIGGHTDGVGGEADNMRLSQRRSDSVRLYLLNKGVTAQLTAIGFGETRPIVNADTPEAKAANRRVEFQIMQRKIIVEKQTSPSGSPPTP